MARSKLQFDWSSEDAPDNLVMFEPALARRRRLAQQAKDGKKALEIDRTGSERHLERAAKRLRHVKAVDRILYVPHWDMAKAEAAMRRAGVRGAVSNLCGSQRKRVKPGR
ncbi:MAG TPA: hypothetical protein PLS69_09160 [Terricaulis sp.]|nr:hypothetical protein [Terricaulis sp.]HRP10482.1 hypothetical protein [Terricaulis sp.]